MYLPGLVGAPVSPIESTLNRASRTAAGSREEERREDAPTSASCHSDHLKTSRAGATPNEMTSASESICSPNALCVLVSRATRPSSMSKNSANTSRSERAVVVVVALRGRAEADRVEPAEHAGERDDVRQEEQRLAKIELTAGVRQDGPRGERAAGWSRKSGES